MSEEYPEWCPCCNEPISSSRELRKCSKCGKAVCGNIGCHDYIDGCLRCKKDKD